MNLNSTLYALGAILLGAIGIWFQDFAMQWQAVPKSIPAMPYAYVSAALLLVGGLLIIAKRERAGALLLASFYGLWVVAFHLPMALASAGRIGAWNAPAEIAFLTMGAVALLAGSAGGLGPTLKLLARVIAGLSAIVFGFAHFNYIDFTASFVPGWIPYKVFWAWATGAGHLLAGLALVSGVRSRLAASCEAAMMASFVVLLHLPRVMASPDQHIEWLMLAIATSLTGAAVLIRKYAT
jgi:uncharacterized membrane protein YphA (DoxX/SURF4 family)